MSSCPTRDPEAEIGTAMLKSLLNASRYLVLAAVFGALLGAAALFVYGLVDVVVVIARTIAAARSRPWARSS